MWTLAQMLMLANGQGRRCSIRLLNAHASTGEGDSVVDPCSTLMLARARETV